MHTSWFRLRLFVPPALSWALAVGLSGLGLTVAAGMLVERAASAEAREQARDVLQRRVRLLQERLPALETHLRWLASQGSSPLAPLARPPLAHVAPSRIQAALATLGPNGAQLDPRPSNRPEMPWLTSETLATSPLAAVLKQASLRDALAASPPFRTSPRGPELVAFAVAPPGGSGAFLVLPLADLLEVLPGDGDGAFVVRALHAGEAPPPGSMHASTDLAGRTWALALASAPLPDGRAASRILLFGSLGSLLAGTAVGLASVRRSRSRFQIRRRSRANQRALLRFQHLVRESPLAVIDWGPSGRIVGWNPAAEEVFGYRAGEVVGQPGLPLLFPGGPGEAFLDAFRAAQAGQVPPTALASGSRRSGETVLGEWSHVPARNAAGLVQGVTSLVLDVTRKHEAALNLQQHQRLESLGVLAGGIAHDFNNILGIQVGHLEQALRHLETDPAQVRQHLEKIDQALSRASGLARQMLAYAGRVAPHPEAVDLNRTLAGMLDLLHASLPKLHALETELGEALPPVRMDEAQLQQVIINLATNATEALGAQPGHIWIRTRLTELEPEALATLPPGLPMKAGPAVVLEVEDDGCGMDLQVLERVFDPFFTTKFSGRGLGLSVILGILKSHGASLRIRSKAGKGSRFEVLLPLHPAPEALQAPPCPESASGQPATVLFADDEPMLRELAQQALSMDGHRVLLAEDGEAALALFEAHRPEIRLVILDVTMPRMGGLEVYRQIRQQEPELPVLLSSGYTERELPEDPTTQFLSKPYRIQHLRGRAMTLLAPETTGASRK